MKSRMFLFTIPLLLLCAWLAAQSPRAPAGGVLVLRNGQMLIGDVIRQGDTYVVTIAEGNQVRIPAHEVRLESRTLEEAYRAQRDTLAPGDLAGRLILANWCLRAEMPHRAADQVLMVRLRDPHHEHLALVERRLAAWEMARRAAAESSSEPPAAQSGQADPFDTSKLDAAVAELPPEVVEAFANRIQPLLSNRCGASGCHGFSSKNDFQLMRPAFHSTFTRRYTQRNLVAALAQIDVEAPDESPLLKRAMAIHGGEQEPKLVERREQQNELLAEWIRAVAKKPKAPQAAAAAKQPAAVKPANRHLLQSHSPVVRGDQSQPLPAAHTSDSTPPAANSMETSPRSNPPAVESFDPSIFNQRYHGRP